jgi:hypothetical protein
MRLVPALVVLWSGLAVADPPMTEAATPEAPKEPVIRIRPPDAQHRMPTLDGQAEARILVVPTPDNFPDARAYPRGMVIRPPDVRDDGIFIVPGRTLMHELGSKLQDGFDALGKLLTPQT